ncbi:MAG: DUF1624 domain-containing protein [Bacilli bacterium]|nr:DUF1624 domain-containing protein [Bacilli bacterium]
MDKEERLQIKTAKKDEMNKKRIWELDFLRAIIIVGMLIDHLFVDFADSFPVLFNRDLYLANPVILNIYNFGYDYWYSPVRIFIRFIGLFFLTVLIGISTQLSKNNLKRSLIFIIVGLAIDGVFAAAHYIANSQFTFMNVVLCYGLCLLIYTAIHALFGRFSKIWKWICLGIGVAILVMWGFVRYSLLKENFDPIYNNFWLIFNNEARVIPKINDISEFTFGSFMEMVIGLRRIGSDWLGLFPFLGYIFIGAFIGQTLYKDKLSFLHYFDKEGEMTLNEKFNIKTRHFLFIGRHSIWFYFLHQPVYFLLALLIIGAIIGIPLSF